MGLRTNIIGIKKATKSEVCLGKMVAYVDPKEIKDTVNWIDQHLKEKVDIEYFAQYKEIGECGEYITFDTKFTHEEVLEFTEVYLKDKSKMQKWNNTGGIKETVEDLKGFDYYQIEWIGA